jgi:hypothetical protein
MLTYSINISSPTETTSYPLTNILIGPNSTFNFLLDKVYDNESLLVSPRDLRNFILSINDSTIFKLTNNTNGSFIGFNKGYPNDPDLKGYKIVIGNKLYNDNTPLLTDDNINNISDDIILSKTTNLDKTKISFLTNSSKYPYIESSIDLNITNEDNINITSSLDRVNINNINFPTLEENETDINQKYLVYRIDKLVWEEINLQIDGNYTISNNQTNITGNLYINQFPLEIKDDRKIPINIGDIIIGENITNKISLSDILKRIVYTYLPPNVNIEFLPPHQYNAMEVGSLLYPKVKYTINKKSLPINVSFINLEPSSIPSVNTKGYSNYSGILDTIYFNPIANTSYNFIAKVEDTENIIEKTLALNITYPFFYGFSITNITNLNFLLSLDKLVINKNNIELDIQGSGTFYYIYPYSYGLLSNIVGNINTPTISTFFFNSPNLYWQNIRFYVYRFSNVNINITEKINFIF